MVDYPVDKPAMPAHIHSKDQTSSSRSTFSKDRKTVTQTVLTKITEMEPIDSITVPHSWRKALNHPDEGALSTSITFTPANGNGASLSIFDRGIDVGKAAADQFKTLLLKPSHVLSNEEVSALGYDLLDTIGDASAFSIRQAETRLIGGKRLLRIDGEWKSGGKQFVGYYFPEWAHQAGQKLTDFQSVKEVYFEGNDPEFSKLLPEANSAMESIVWKR